MIKCPYLRTARPVGWIGLGRVRHSKREGGTGFSSSFHDLSSDTRLAFEFVCWVVLIEVPVSDSCQNLKVCRTTAWDLCGGDPLKIITTRRIHRVGLGETTLTFPHSISRVVSGADNPIFPRYPLWFPIPPTPGSGERKKDI